MVVQTADYAIVCTQTRTTETTISYTAHNESEKVSQRTNQQSKPTSLPKYLQFMYGHNFPLSSLNTCDISQLSTN